MSYIVVHSSPGLEPLIDVYETGYVADLAFADAHHAFEFDGDRADLFFISSVDGTAECLSSIVYQGV